MQSLMDLKTDEIRRSISGAESFVLSCQYQDGFWRDYALPPGASEAWTTAWVGLSLSMGSARSYLDPALERAADALFSISSKKGWGYNRRTATDADSTAWTIRFLSRVNRSVDPGIVSALKKHLNHNGEASTFLNIEKFGSWALKHPDVTPVVGMALMTIDSEPSMVRKIRQACLGTWRKQGTWPSFWWTIESYAIARNLEFLYASGGVPEKIRRGTWNRLNTFSAPRSSIEAACNLTAAIFIEKIKSKFSSLQIEKLLKWQQGDHSWPPSKVLLVPDQRNGHSTSADHYEDTMSVMSTSMVIYALNIFLETRERVKSSS